MGNAPALATLRQLRETPVALVPPGLYIRKSHLPILEALPDLVSFFPSAPHANTHHAPLPTAPLYALRAQVRLPHQGSLARSAQVMTTVLAYSLLVPLSLSKCPSLKDELFGHLSPW